MIFQSIKYKLGSWEATKKIVSSETENLTYFVNFMIEILKQLDKTKLFIPSEYKVMAKSYPINNEDIYHSEFWHNVLYREKTHHYSCWFKGNTLIYENNQAEYQFNALQIFFTLDTFNNEVTLSFDIEVRSDNFAPNFMITRVDPNLDYEKNHGRLHKLLQWLITQDYSVKPDDDNHETATFIDLEIHNYVQDNEIILYTENGTIDDWFNINDIDFRGKLYNYEG